MNIQNRVFGGNVLGLLLLVCCIVVAPLSAQNGTRGETGNDDQLKNKLDKKKVLLIPFDPKMYMSEIDRNLCAESKLTFKQLRDQFRIGLDNQLVSAFKNGYTVITLLRDTAKTKADLQFIYHSTGYKYTVTKGKDKAPEQKAITKGQLTTPVMDEEERYMRTVINQPGLLEAMNKKYGAELFVFISEVDLKPAVTSDPDPMREAWVHFTVYDLSGTQVGGGLSKVKFDPGLNDPKKIISRYFSDAARAIYARAVPQPVVHPGVEKTTGKQ